MLSGLCSICMGDSDIAKNIFKMLIQKHIAQIDSSFFRTS